MGNLSQKQGGKNQKPTTLKASWNIYTYKKNLSGITILMGRIINCLMSLEAMQILECIVIAYVLFYLHWDVHDPRDLLDAYLIAVGSNIFSGLPASLGCQETKESGSFSGNLWGLHGVWSLTCWLILRLQQDSPSGSWDSLHRWGSCQFILAAKLFHPTSGEGSFRNSW